MSRRRAAARGADPPRRENSTRRASDPPPQRRERRFRGKPRLLDSAAIPFRRPSIDLNAFLAPYLGAIVVGLLVVVVLLMLLAILAARRIRRLQERLDGLTRGSSGRSIEAILEAHLEKVHHVARELDELSARSAILEGGSRRALQRVGLVRFNPFEETGGNQSFAFALLDARGDGFVVSSLHARTGTRVYAKALSGGQAESPLSTEEARAVEQALAGPGSTTPRTDAGRAERARPAS